MKRPRVEIMVSDPWELGESVKWQPIRGDLVKVDMDLQGGRALVKLDQPLVYRGVPYQFAVVVPRHRGCSLQSLQEGGKVFCAFTAVSDEHAKSSNALSIDHWRGGLAFIGDIESLNPCS